MSAIRCPRCGSDRPSIRLSQAGGDTCTHPFHEPDFFGKMSERVAGKTMSETREERAAPLDRETEVLIAALIRAANNGPRIEGGMLCGEMPEARSALRERIRMLSAGVDAEKVREALHLIQHYKRWPISDAVARAISLLEDALRGGE